jgi:hypothetical protein
MTLYLALVLRSRTTLGVYIRLNQYQSLYNNAPPISQPITNYPTRNSTKVHLRPDIHSHRRGTPLLYRKCKPPTESQCAIPGHLPARAVNNTSSPSPSKKSIRRMHRHWRLINNTVPACSKITKYRTYIRGSCGSQIFHP